MAYERPLDVFSKPVTYRSKVLFSYRGRNKVSTIYFQKNDEKPVDQLKDELGSEAGYVAEMIAKSALEVRPDQVKIKGFYGIAKSEDDVDGIFLGSI